MWQTDSCVILPLACLMAPQSTLSMYVVMPDVAAEMTDALTAFRLLRLRLNKVERCAHVSPNLAQDKAGQINRVY